MDKKRILWVVFNFVQAGGQRYVYEITKALNKQKYDIDFLRLASFGSEKGWEDEYYYYPTLLLGCKVYQVSEFLSVVDKPSRKNSIWRRGVRFLMRKIEIKSGRRSNSDKLTDKSNEKLQRFISNYDYINFSGISCYKSFHLVKGLNAHNSIIHLLTGKFQDINLYSGLDRSQFYNFVSAMMEESIKKELYDFTNYKFTHFNLCFETIPYNIVHCPNPASFKIAVFTRLSKMKPLDPYFYTLKLLIEQGINVELNIYGAGNPEELGLINQINYLYIQNNVKFRGHVEDIRKELEENTPHLLWYQSFNNQPAGYAALEISMSGLPQIFWDFMFEGDYKYLHDIFPSFTEISSFADCTKKLLFSAEQRKKLGDKQRGFVLEHYSIYKNIHILEDLLI